VSFDVALGAEPAVRLGDGRAGDLQAGGYRPGRGESVSGLEPALDDRGTHLLVQLDRPRSRIVRIEEELHTTIGRLRRDLV
jgi:hypothetical protein